jgi:hypothetical protein
MRLVGAAVLVAAGSVAAYVMMSGPSYSDGPMPSVRGALGCKGEVYVARQVARQATGEPSAEAALQSGLLSTEQWWLETDAVRVAHNAKNKVLYVYDVDASARFSAIVERDDDSQWRLTSWAMCDPNALTNSQAEAIGYGVWLDAAGAPVPTDRVMSLHGSDRCGWQDVGFILLNRDADKPLVLVNDPGRHFTDKQLMSTYSGHATLPDDARDSGWRRGGFSLWTQPFGDAAYLVNLADPSDVVRLPRARFVITCQE